jgi:thiol-disulfide isomerase/thioredoxin
MFYLNRTTHADLKPFAILRGNEQFKLEIIPDRIMMSLMHAVIQTSNILTRVLTGSLFVCMLTGTAAAAVSPNMSRHVVVTGKINSYQGSAPISLAITRLGFGQEELTIQPDVAGKFSFRFDTFIPVDAWLSYKTNFLLLLHPGDSLYVEFDGTTNDRIALLNTITFQRDPFDVNRKAALFQKLYYGSHLYRYDYGRQQNRIKSATPAEFLLYCDSLRQVAMAFQHAFVKKENPGTEVSDWSKLFVERSYYDNVSFYPDNHRKAFVLKYSEWDVPVKYYALLRKYHDIKKSLISADAISSYIPHYVYRYIMGNIEHDITGFNSSLSREQRDSLILTRIIKDSETPLIKEISLCFLLNNRLEESALKTFEKNYAIADAHITQPFLREPLQATYAKKRQEIDNSSTIIGQPWLSGSSAAVDSIIQHNKGKVIYIDIWATWCAPCRQEFPYSNKLEDTFSNDVVFLYLCIDSDKDAYQNMLEKIAHKGFYNFLSKKESQLLREKHAITGVPHYMVIDKSGHLVYGGYALRPSQDETSATLRKLTQQ